MTNAQLEDIYKTALADGRIAALRAVWNAGWYEAKGITPTANSADQSTIVAKPAAVVRTNKK